MARARKYTVLKDDGAAGTTVQAAAARYVVDGTTIKHNGASYPDGSEIELTEDEAAKLHVRPATDGGRPSTES